MHSLFVAMYNYLYLGKKSPNLIKEKKRKPLDWLIEKIY